MRRPTWFTAGLVFSMMFALSVLTTPATRAQAPSAAAAELKDAQGQTVGRATLTATASGAVEIQVTLSGFVAASAGDHGIHIHTTGRCDAPEFTSAGGHFNPTTKQHGLNNPAGPHGGDLPNLQVGTDGNATYNATTDRITLGAGPTSVFDADGSALVIHAGPDDLQSDPAGNSGARIACGVLQAAETQPVTLPDTGGSWPAVYHWLALAVLLLIAGLLLRQVRHIRNP